MSKPLIIGADSMIGAALKARLNAEGTTRETLDLAAGPKTWPPLPAADVAYICAAVSKLDACENNPEAARRVNVMGTAAIAKRLHDAGTFVVFLSSNHVFDGTKPLRSSMDMVCPLNEYGRQKAQTEQLILALPPLTPPPASGGDKGGAPCCG